MDRDKVLRLLSEVRERIEEIGDELKKAVSNALLRPLIPCGENLYRGNAMGAVVLRPPGDCPAFQEVDVSLACGVSTTGNLLPYEDEIRSVEGPG